MNLKQQLTNDMKTAMKAGEKNTLKTVRSILTEVKQFEVDNRVEPKDSQILKIIQKMVKQRKDSIEQFTKAARDDLIQIEQQELDVIVGYKLFLDDKATIKETKQGVSINIKT